MTLILPNLEVQALIRQSNNEDVKTGDESLQAIKEWLAKQPHLPNTWDEICIMSFLRGCHFSLEQTKRKLDLYFTMRSAVPELFSNRNIKGPELQEVIKQINFSPLPVLTSNGERVLVFKTKEKFPIHLFNEKSLKLQIMIGDVRFIEEKFGVAGDIVIVDSATLTPAYFGRFNPGLARKFLICMQEAFPLNLKQTHIVNAHSLISVVYNWFKPFLNEEIRNQVHFHSNGYESLHKFLHKNVLPEEYGGSAGKLQDLHDEWMKKLEEYAPWFEEQENIKADESKRPGKPTNYDDLFGMSGSFKQLTVD